MEIYFTYFVCYSVALYSEQNGKMICMFQGQQGGVTHLKFSTDGSKLYSGGRKVVLVYCIVLYCIVLLFSVLYFFVSH